jgi:hypothetical protein
MRINKDQIEGLSNVIYTDTESSTGVGHTATIKRTVINGAKAIIEVTFDVSASGSVSIPYIPQDFRSKKFFKVTTMIANLHTLTSGRDFGTLTFNKLLDNTPTNSVIQLNGVGEGQFNYIDDTVLDTSYSGDGTFTIEYNATYIPNITSSSLNVTYTPYAFGVDQAVGKVVLVIEGLLL